MRSKLNYLISVSLKRKVCSKWFLIANIILCLVIISVINIDSIIKFFGGDFEKSLEIYVDDETNRAYDIFSNQFSSDSFQLSNYNDVKVSRYSGEDLDSFLNKDNYVVIKLYDTKDDVLKAEVSSLGFINAIDYQFILNALSNTKISLNIVDSRISQEEFNKIYEDVEISRVILDEKKKSDDEKDSVIMTTVFPILILPFFFLVLFVVQMIGAEVNDEKTTRGMEVIISNVSPSRHLASKVIAANLFVFIQGFLLVCFGGIGIFVRKIIGGGSITNGFGGKILDLSRDVISNSVFNNLIYIIPLVLFLMLLTFVAYSILAGVLASITTNTEDFQQLQTPILVISMVSFYLSMMSSMFNGSLFIKICSFIPFISAILSPSLLILEQISIFDVCISICIMIVTIFILIKYGMRIYKVGILNYSSKGLWKKMFEAVRKR